MRTRPADTGEVNVAGTVNADASTQAGTGFTTVKTAGSGNYTVTLSGFRFVKGAVGTNAISYGFVRVMLQQPNAITVVTTNSAGTPTDQAFSFQVTGRLL